ncbi:MAG: hypothetical protein ACLRWQ_19600 [Flavonifractor plautii]
MTFPTGCSLLDNACVLAVLEKEDAYGYSLTQRMKEVVELLRVHPLSGAAALAAEADA